MATLVHTWLGEVNMVDYSDPDPKGQIISRGLFSILEFSQKTNKRIRFYDWNEFIR